MRAGRSRIQDEIRQRRPFRSRGQEALIALLRTADLVRRRLAVVVEPQGITLQQYNVLRILRGAGPAGLPTLEIAERMIEHAPGITRLLDRLERKRLVKRERCPSDRRQILCTIAPEGLGVLARLERPVAAADESWAAGVDRRDLEVLIRILDAVRAEASPIDANRNKRNKRRGIRRRS